MKHKITIFLLLIGVATIYAEKPLTEHIGEHVGWTSMFSLPQSEIDAHFYAVQERVDYRWSLTGLNYPFPLYAAKKNESALIEEFYRFSNQRVQLWLNNPESFPCESNPLFKVSQAHLTTGRFRQPCCITFEHSATDSSYNSSSISFGNRRFFALEGPLEEHVPYFFRLLTNWNVAYLVCLTDETDDHGTPKCFPYWKDRVIYDGDTTYLQVTVHGAYEQNPTNWGEKNIPYLFWPDWQDHHGVDPRRLIDAANQIRNNTEEREIIAVHCSAGVGRTGTMIAAICLLDEIDQQLYSGSSIEDLEVHIAGIFSYLNFHRPWLVAKPSQYLSLYKMVELYLDELSKE